MSDELMIKMCPPKCDEAVHDWTGPWIKTPDLVSSVTCKNCGLAKVDFDLMVFP